MIWQSELALAVCWVVMAAWHSHLIKQNRPILHGLWALLSCTLMVAAGLWARVDNWGILIYQAAQGCSRLVVFNVSLNLFRRLKWDYTSPASTSILDKLEIRLFGGRVWLLEVILAAIFFILQIFI